jgi:hypothetical protein
MACAVTAFVNPTFPPATSDVNTLRVIVSATIYEHSFVLGSVKGMRWMELKQDRDVVDT